MSASIPNRIRNTPQQRNVDLTALIPDFPFDYGKFLDDAKAAGRAPFYVSPEFRGKKVAVVGGGLTGAIVAYELLRAGLRPVILEGNQRIGGRMLSTPLGGGLAEMGSMRFPPTCKALFHYFGKAGMTANMAPFPNPGTPAAPGTVIDYKGKTQYYDVNNPDFPLPDEYKKLSTMWDNLIKKDPFRYEEMQQCMVNPTETNVQRIKQIWNGFLASWDEKTFYEALVTDGWSFEDIELFGQVGFGSGGWNTDFVNTFLEVLRVSYTAMDSDHQLMYDGCDHLPKTLWSKTPQELGDPSVIGALTQSVETITRENFSSFPNAFLNTQILNISYSGNQYHLTPQSSSGLARMTFDAVVYTAHVRSLQMHSALDRSATEYPQMRAMLDADRWEAIEYTHYMQSSKVFIKASRPFWEDKIPGGQHKMSTTLSDRLTRGTYLLNYGKDGDTGKAVICLSYTWNDDSLKFIPFNLEQRVMQTMTVLRDIYRDVNFEVEEEVGTHVSWELEPGFIGAFKNNLPGQYRYQRELFSQFAEPRTEAERRFVLAGDDVSWTAGWAEGAVTTALNAVHRIVKEYGGSAFNNQGPLDRWNDLQPLKL